MHVVLYAQFLMIYFSQGLIHIKGLIFLICATVEKTRGRRAKSETCWAVP